MLQHIPYGIDHGGKLLGFLLCLLIFGVYRRNVWLTGSSGIALVSAFLCWQYGYTPSSGVAKLPDVCAFLFAPAAFVIFQYVIIRGRVKSSGQV